MKISMNTGQIIYFFLLDLLPMIYPKYIPRCSFPKNSKSQTVIWKNPQELVNNAAYQALPSPTGWGWTFLTSSHMLFMSIRTALKRCSMTVKDWCASLLKAPVLFLSRKEVERMYRKWVVLTFFSIKSSLQILCTSQEFLYAYF